MAKAHVAPLAQRPPHTPSAVVVVDYQTALSATYHALSSLPSNFNHGLLIWANSGHPAIQLSVRPAARSAPAIEARVGFLVGREVLYVERFLLSAFAASCG